MFKKIIFGCLVGAIVGTANMTSVQDQAVPYQVLKYGTHDVSYASAYFVTPGDSCQLATSIGRNLSLQRSTSWAGFQ